jgi:hypothetical protein
VNLKEAEQFCGSMMQGGRRRVNRSGLRGLEMHHRGLYHDALATHQGTATDPVAPIADPANHELGMIKCIRAKPHPTPRHRRG